MPGVVAAALGRVDERAVLVCDVADHRRVVDERGVERGRVVGDVGGPMASLTTDERMLGVRRNGAGQLGLGGENLSRARTRRCSGARRGRRISTISATIWRSSREITVV